MEDAITLSLKKTEIELEKIGIDLLKFSLPLKGSNNQ